jgi:hypothetical protein
MVLDDTGTSPYLDDPDWVLGRVTELLLMGHSWKSVQNIVMLSKRDFDYVLDCAITKARREQRQVKERYRSAA